MKPEASFYIPKEETSVKEVNHTLSNQSKGLILDALNNQNSKLTFDLGTMCDNLTLQGQTEFTQRYAVGAITKIINGQPVTNRTMLDSLFNTYAPAFNASLVKFGYNSVAAMKDAALKGTINPASFLGALDSGLAAIQEEADSLSRFDKYGDEIPVDVVELFSIDYKNVIAEHTISGDIADYITNHGNSLISVTGHVKNENAEIWNMADFSNKLTDAMVKKKPVVFRIGKSIYENVLIGEYTPTIKNIYDLSFVIKLKYNYFLAQESRLLSNGMRIVNGKGNQEIINLLAEPQYVGEGKVEKVSENESLVLKSILQEMGIG